jgi:hypothetical protein
MRRTPAALPSACFSIGIGLGILVPLTQAPPQAAKPWTENRQQIEEFLRTARIEKMEDVKVGVTHPHRAQLEPGGPVREIAWKPIHPGLYNGYYESYKSEVAAYEIDKLLELEMVPPTVEKRYSGVTGAAIMWIGGTRSFKETGGVPGTIGAKVGPPPAKMYLWNRQLMKAKMFDNLIANVDPNLGNWLVDADWDLILIDHSRALTPTKELYHKMQQIDGPLWDRMKALTENQLTAAVGQWLDKGQIRAVLQRRDRMHAEIDRMVKDKGEAAIIVR